MTNNNHNNNNPFLTCSVYVLHAIIRDCENGGVYAKRLTAEEKAQRLDWAIRALWAAEKEGRNY